MMSYRHDKIISVFSENFYSGSGISLGRSVIGKEVTLNPDALRRHLVILGKTGTGKSNILRVITAEIIRRKLGSVVLLDPHGDTARSISCEFPRSTMVLSPYPLDRGSEKMAVTINPLSVGKSVNNPSAVSGWIREAFSTESSLSQGTWGPRLELIFTSLLNQLMVSRPGATLGDLLSLLTDQLKMKLFLKDVTDDNLRQFLKSQMADWRGWNQYVSSSVNKLLPIISDPGLRNIASGRVDSVDLFQYIQEDARILVAEIWRGITSDENYRILSVLLLLKLWMLSMESTDMKFPVYVVIDEAQLLSENIMDRLLREGRKFGFRLIIATQFIGRSNEKIRESIKGNVANFLSFSLSEEEAENIARNFFEGDIKKRLTVVLRSQAVHRCVIWSQNEAGVIGPLSFTPNLSSAVYSDETFGEIRRRSTEDYGTVIYNDDVQEQLIDLHEHLLDLFEKFLKKKKITLERGTKVNGTIPDGIFEYRGTRFIVEVEVSDILNRRRIKEKLTHYYDHKIVFLVPSGFHSNILEILLSKDNLSSLTDSGRKNIMDSIKNFSVVEVEDSCTIFGLDCFKKMSMDDLFLGSVMFTIENLKFPEIRKYILKRMIGEGKVVTEFPAEELKMIFGSDNSEYFRNRFVRDGNSIAIQDLFVDAGDET